MYLKRCEGNVTVECKRVSEDAILGEVEHEAAANPIMMVERNGNG